MKKVLTAFICLVLLFVPTVIAEEERPLIAISQYNSSDYQMSWLALIEKYCDEMNCDMVYANAELNVEKQLADIESLIVQEPDVIIVRAVDSDGITSGLDAISAAGIPCLISSYSVNSDNYTVFLEAPQRLTGELQADYLMQILEENPELELKVCYLWGSYGNTGCNDRFDGWYENSVAVSDRITLLDEQVADWSTATAMSITENWLQSYPDANCFVCQNDEMAIGVANALEGAGIDPESTWVIGIDGNELGAVAILDGQLDATVYTDQDTDARVTIEYCVRIANGESWPDDEKVVEVNTKAIMDKNNVEELFPDL